VRTYKWAEQAIKDWLTSTVKKPEIIEEQERTIEYMVATLITMVKNLEIR
jgi:hypothetical protein